jgi:hypothetical protein
MPIARGRGISHVFETLASPTDFDGFVWGSTDVSNIEWGDNPGVKTWGDLFLISCISGLFNYPTHGYQANQNFFYEGPTNTELTNGSFYYVIVIDDDNFRLSATPSGAPVVTDTFNNLQFLK